MSEVNEIRRQVMGRTVMVSFLVICSAATAEALTYQWTDDQGVIGFTDDKGNIPAKYRNRIRTREDITIRNPDAQQELRVRERRLRREEQRAPGGPLFPEESIPSAVPDSAPGSGVSPGRRPASDSLPPGRTKSQRIRDNIERRQVEE